MSCLLTWRETGFMTFMVSSLQRAIKMIWLCLYPSLFHSQWIRPVFRFGSNLLTILKRQHNQKLKVYSKISELVSLNIHTFSHKHANNSWQTRHFKLAVFAVTPSHILARSCSLVGPFWPHSNDDTVTSATANIWDDAFLFTTPELQRSFLREWQEIVLRQQAALWKHSGSDMVEVGGGFAAWGELKISVTKLSFLHLFPFFPHFSSRQNSSYVFSSFFSTPCFCWCGCCCWHWFCYSLLHDCMFPVVHQ